MVQQALKTLQHPDVIGEVSSLHINVLGLFEFSPERR